VLHFAKRTVEKGNTKKVQGEAEALLTHRIYAKVLSTFLKVDTPIDRDIVIAMKRD
jgi:hypothetical protein